MKQKLKDKSAIIPFRKKKDKIEFLLIRNVADTRWIVPKGTIERPLKPSISATKEAYEEAGVLGKLHPFVIGEYLKNEQKVPVYLLEVDIELEHYSEQTVRNRKWIDSKLIDLFVKEESLQILLKRAYKCLTKKGQYFKYSILNYCKYNDLECRKISRKKASINFKYEKGKKQTVHIKRFKSTLEFLIDTSICVDKMEDIPPRYSNSFLLDNSEHKIGFWSIRKLDSTFHLSRMHNTKLKLLNNKYFIKILESLSADCDSFETEYKQ